MAFKGPGSSSFMKELVSKKKDKRKVIQKKKGSGRFFFHPEVPSPWAQQLRHRIPVFLFDRAWIWGWGKKVEIHLLLYISVQYPELKTGLIRWQQLVTTFPKKYSKKKLQKYVYDYERMMRSRKFPEWTAKQEKRARKLSYFTNSLIQKEWYPVFFERQLNHLWFSSLESRLTRLFFSKDQKVKMRYHYVKSPWLSSSLCARYFLWRLRQRRLNFYYLIRNFLSRTNFYGGEKHNLYGIFISGAGRFTKRQRASYMKVQKGRVPFSSVDAPLDYSEISLPLKYGACSVRVWVCHLKGK